MPSLPTLLIDGDGSSPRAWSIQTYLSVDEGISAADGLEIAAALTNENRGTSLDTSFTMDDTPADLGNVDTLSWTVRHRANSSSGDDSLTGAIRVMSGATVLAAADAGGTFATVQTGQNTTWSTSLGNTGPTAFSYVNTGASKAQWDAMTVELRSTHSQSMGPDDNHWIVDTLELTGTYTAAAAGGGSKYLPSLGF